MMTSSQREHGALLPILENLLSLLAQELGK